MKDIKPICYAGAILKESPIIISCEDYNSLDESLQDRYQALYTEDQIDLLLLNQSEQSPFSLSELEEKRFKDSKPKKITFFFGGGIGVKKVIVDDDGEEIDITDYGCW